MLVVPHGSSVYSYHFVITRHNSPFAEFLMMHPVPQRGRADVLAAARRGAGPEQGRLKLSDTPGFGVELDPATTLERPFTH